MNKYQKQLAKYAKKISSNASYPLNNFKVARRFCEVTLYGTDKDIEDIKNYILDKHRGRVKIIWGK